MALFFLHNYIDLILLLLRNVLHTRDEGLLSSFILAKSSSYLR